MIVDTFLALQVELTTRSLKIYVLVDTQQEAKFQSLYKEHPHNNRVLKHDDPQVKNMLCGLTDPDAYQDAKFRLKDVDVVLLVDDRTQAGDEGKAELRIYALIEVRAR